MLDPEHLRTSDADLVADLRRKLLLLFAAARANLVLIADVMDDPLLDLKLSAGRQIAATVPVTRAAWEYRSGSEDRPSPLARRLILAEDIALFGRGRRHLFALLAEHLPTKPLQLRRKTDNLVTLGN